MRINYLSNVLEYLRALAGLKGVSLYPRPLHEGVVDADGAQHCAVRRAAAVEEIREVGLVQAVRQTEGALRSRRGDGAAKRLDDLVYRDKAQFCCRANGRVLSFKHRVKAFLLRLLII